MGEAVRFLVIDGYDAAGREELRSGDASTAGDLYTAMLGRILPAAVCDVIHPADPGVELPDGVALEQYDAIAWTGCSLTIYHDDPKVTRQIELAKVAFEKGIPSFGSCWAMQIAVVAAGGVVQAHPEGREMGLARKIELTPEGRAHPLYEGKPNVFDGFISHIDEVTHISPGTVILAGNAYTRVQAAAITHKNGTFWGLQYHPEYNLHEMARLIFCRAGKLIKRGFFADEAAVHGYVDKLEGLHQDPNREDLAWQLGYDADVMNEQVRVCEVRNWIERLVIPTKVQRSFS